MIERIKTDKGNNLLRGTVSIALDVPFIFIRLIEMEQ